MKRCPYCGAKNKSSFEYCIRCSEPLDAGAPEAVVAKESRNVAKLLIAGVAGIVVLAAIGLLLRSNGPTGSDRPVAEASSRPSGTATAGRSNLRPPGAVDPGIDSKEVLATFSEGVAAFNQQDYLAASDIFQDVIDEIPENPSAHQFLGLCFFHLQQFPEAMRALEEARRLRPDSFELLDHYVTVAKKAGDLESASSALSDYVQRNPNVREARLELSRIARDLGRPDEALDQASYLATSDEASPEFKYEYGVSLKAAGRLDEAIEVLRSTVELNPSSAVAQHALGVTTLEAGRPKDAVGPLEQAVARAPENGDFRFSLAQAYEKLDRIPESLAAYEAYLQRAGEADPRAKVVRERLTIARKALAEREERAKSETQGVSR
ncbi:MAG TPA: tetratricopeptide repeat protein [Vicinamibacteria bacterium]